MEFLWIVVFVTISYGRDAFGQAQSPGKYGDRCSLISACDSEARLSCVDDFCRCSRSEEIYDQVRVQCALREGEACLPPKFNFGEYNPCVSNAFCSDNQICVCAAHSYPDGLGRCLRKKFYNDTCSSSKECDDLKYLSCMDGKCSCKLSSYDDYYQICRRRVGDMCRRSRECVKNADCIENKCVCRANYSETAAKTCGLSYGQPCGGPNDKSCSDIFYACVNGACRCKNPSYEIYDNTTQTCLSLVGGLCHLYFSNKKIQQPLRLKNCVPNAECVRRELSPLSQCECDKGFVETVSGHCRLPHGAVCKIPGEEESLKCIEPLVCRNMRCECQNENDVYDPEDKNCKKIIGTICEKDSECVSSAKCEHRRCRCPIGFLPTFRGSCEEDTAKTSSQNYYKLAVPPENLDQSQVQSQPLLQEEHEHLQLQSQVSQIQEPQVDHEFPEREKAQLTYHNYNYY